MVSVNHLYPWGRKVCPDEEAPFVMIPVLQEFRKLAAEQQAGAFAISPAVSTKETEEIT